MLAFLKNKNFKTAVGVHLKTAKPIGSKTLVRRHLRQLAALTIRTYLAELVDEDLLESINFSLGRIPTNLGWRTFFERHKKIDDDKMKTSDLTLKSLAVLKLMLKDLRSFNDLRLG